MPLSGGPSDKLGNNYEQLWTAKVMLDLLGANKGQICVEALDDDWEKAEFWVDRDGQREGHQVKRQHGFDGAWSLSTLKSKDVLDGLKKILRQPDRQAHFVSRIGVEDLTELAERARMSPDFESFKKHYLEAKSAQDSFSAFRKYWDSTRDDEAAFQDLRRIHTDVIAPDLLQDYVRALAVRWFSEAHLVVVGALTQVAIENMAKPLDPPEIWRGLSAHGIRPRPQSDVHSQTLAIKACCNKYLANGGDLNGHHIDRGVVVESIRADLSMSRLVWVIGEAGSGKSEVLRDVVRATASQVLPFRLDLLQPTCSARAVGEQLDLASGPVETLAAAAQGKDALLVIDQLDTVSAISGRRDDLLEAVREILSDAANHTNIRVLVACRTFDLENDHRLKQVAARFEEPRRQHVGGLQASEISEVLGYNIGGPQLGLLALPLHLAMYTSITSEGPFTFNNATDLFREYVARKRKAVEARTNQEHWREITDALLDVMSHEEQLSAPWRMLDRWERFAEAMVSEHVLVMEGDRVRFFHEALFDYLLAYNFDPKQPLADWISAKEQGLFQRARVRQLLTFRRDEHPAQYTRDLRELLLGDKIRFHLQRLVVAWVASQANPTAEEAGILASFILNAPSPRGEHALQVTRGCKPWFDLLRGQIPAFLNKTDSSLRQQVLWWLTPMATEVPDDVAELLSDRVNDPEWQPLLAWFVCHCRAFTHGADLVDLVVSLVDSGALDNSRGLWNLWANLRNQNSESLAGTRSIVVALLRRDLVTCKPDSHLSLGSHWAPEVLASLARGAPAAFLTELTDVFLRACAREQRNFTPWDLDGLFWSRDDERKEAWSALKTQLAVALVEALAVGNPIGRKVVTQLSSTSSLTPQQVIADAYRQLGSTFADEAIDWLMAEERRLELRGIPYRTRNMAEELIRAIAPHCSDLRSLEERILLHYPPREEGDRRGRAQWRLLSACPSERMSEAARQRLGELRLKFGEAEPERVGLEPAYMVGSPLPENVAGGMSDDAWIAAMTQHSEDRTSWQGNHLVGGVLELAGQLRRHTKSSPDRFLRLAPQIPTSCNPAYLGAILAGGMDAEVAVERLSPIILQAHQLPDRPLGSQILDCIRQFAAADWSDEVLDCVGWYVADAPPLPSWDAGGADAEQSVQVLTTGINSVQGRGAETIWHLIDRDARRITRFSETLEALVMDPHPAVRTCAAVAVRCVLRYDHDRALSLAKRLLEHRDIALATDPMERLLYGLLSTNTGEWSVELGAMVDNDNEEIALVGSRCSVFASLSDKSMAPLAKRCIRGTAAQRRGAAMILAANVRRAPHQRFCEAGLRALFNDPDREVRNAAGRWTHYLHDSERDVTEFEGLAAAFIRSPAHLEDMNMLNMLFEKSHGNCAALIIEAAEKFLKHTGRDAGDIQTAASYTTHNLQPLILRAYAQTSTSPDLRRRCLDVIDRVYLVNAHDMENLVARLEDDNQIARG